MDILGTLSKFVVVAAEVGFSESEKKNILMNGRILKGILNLLRNLTVRLV